MASSAELVVRVVSDVKGAQAGLNSVGQSASSLGSKLRSGIGAGVNYVATATAAIVTATAGATTAVIAQGVAYNVLQQRARAAFTTVLGSAKAADRMLAQIQRFATTSPFPRQTFIEATQQMLAFGFAAKDVIPTLSAVQDAVAATGGGSQQISEIVDVLSKVQSTGKFTAETLNELGYRGVDAAKIIGQQMGKTAGEIRSMISSGTLPAGKAMDALVKGMSQNFKGAAAGLKDTWVGALDSVKGATRDLGSALVAPFIDPKGGGYAVEWAGQIADLIRSLTDQIAPMFTRAMQGLAPLFDGITRALGSIDLASIFDSVGSALSGLGPLIAAVVAGLTAMGGANIAGMLGPLGSILPTINPVLAVILALIATMPSLRSAVMGLIPPLLSLAKSIGATLGAALKAAMPFISQLVTTLGTAAKQILTALGPAIGDLVAAIGPMIPIFAQLISQIASALLPVFTVLVNVIRQLIPPITQVVIALMPLLKFVAQLAGILLRLLAPVLVVVAKILGVVLVAAVKVLAGGIRGLANIFVRVGQIARTVFNGIRSVVGTVANGVRTTWATVGRAVSAYFRAWGLVARTVWNAIRSVASTVASAVRNTWSNVINGLKALARGLAAPFRAAFDAVRSAASSLASAIRSVLTPAINGLKSVAKGIGSALSAPFNTVKSAVQGVIDAVNSLISALGRIHVPKISLPHIPGLSLSSAYSVPATSGLGLARGIGTYTSGAVAPRRRARASDGASVTEIHVHGLVVDPEGTARAINRILGEHSSRMGHSVRAVAS